MIIGLTGSFGAGKGAVVEYLVKEKGFRHFSARALLIRELKSRNEIVDRDGMIRIANLLRKEHGPTYIIESLFKDALAFNGNAIIESIRELAGVRFIQEHGGFVIGVDADQRLRYERAVKRGSETDSVTYEEWLSQEEQETNPDDPTKQDIRGSLKESDFIIMNNGTLEDLHEQIENVFQKITKTLS